MFATVPSLSLHLLDSFGNIVIVGSSSLTAANIKNGVTIFGVTGTDVGSAVIFGNGAQGNFGGCKFLRDWQVRRYDGSTKWTIYQDTQSISGGRLQYSLAYWIAYGSSTNEMRYYCRPGVLINNKITLSNYSTLRIRCQMSTNFGDSTGNFELWWYDTQPTVQWSSTTWGSIDPDGTRASSNLFSKYNDPASQIDETKTDLSSFTRNAWWVIVFPSINSKLWTGYVYAWLDGLWLY